MEQAQTPRTNTKPSRVFAASAKLVMIRGVFGALRERNTALVTELKIMGAIDAE